MTEPLLHQSDEDATRELAQKIAQISGGTVVEHPHHFTIVPPKRKDPK